MRHAGGLLPLLRRAAADRWRRADRHAGGRPAGRDATRKRRGFVSAETEAGPARTMPEQPTGRALFFRPGATQVPSGLCRDRQRRGPIHQTWQRTAPGLPAFMPGSGALHVNEACRQALVRQHVSVQKAEAAFPIRPRRAGVCAPLTGRGSSSELASGPFSCPNVEPLVQTPPPGSYRSPERHFPRPCDPPTRERPPYRLQFVSRTFFAPAELK